MFLHLKTVSFHRRPLYLLNSLQLNVCLRVGPEEFQTKQIENNWAHPGLGGWLSSKERQQVNTICKEGDHIPNMVKLKVGKSGICPIALSSQAGKTAWFAPRSSALTQDSLSSLNDRDDHCKYSSSSIYCKYSSSSIYCT